MRKRLLGLPRELAIAVIMNAVTFVIYVFTAKNHSGSGYLSTRSIFVSSVIVTVIVLFVVNIRTSWQLGREFYLKQQFLLLIGQVAISLLTIIIAGYIVAFLIRNFITF